MVTKCLAPDFQNFYIELNLLQQGGSKKVLSRKAYEKALSCLKIVSEALERLLLNVFLKQRSEKESNGRVKKLLNFLTKYLIQENLTNADNNKDFKNFITKNIEFTGSFCMSFLDHCNFFDSSIIRS